MRKIHDYFRKTLLRGMNKKKGRPLLKKLLVIGAIVAFIYVIFLYLYPILGLTILAILGIGSFCILCLFLLRKAFRMGKFYYSVIRSNNFLRVIHFHREDIVPPPHIE